MSTAPCPRTFSCPALSGVALALSLLAGPARAQVTHQDKLLHAGASAVVVDVAWAGAAALEQPLWVRIVAGVSAGVVVGVGKEAVDLAGFGTPDVADLLFDGFGIGLGVALALLAEVTLDRHGRVTDDVAGPAPGSGRVDPTPR